MASRQEQEVTLVDSFITTKAPQFHSAFATPSALNRSKMQYERSEVRDLRETLECSQQKARKYLDIKGDLNSCTWEQVHEELHKAQAKAEESEKRARHPVKKMWRKLGASSSVLAPGLAAVPDDLCVLNGGLAVLFSLARHSEMNRLKILSAFASVPNIIETAQNKAKTFPLNSKNPKSVHLHKSIQELQETLLRTLPALINKLVPGTFLNAWKSPFSGWQVDKLLEEVSTCAESVRLCAEGIVEEMIVGSYAASKNIELQLSEVLQQQRIIQMSIEAAHSKTHLLEFLMEQLNFNPPGVIRDRDQESEVGTALPGYTPEDLLIIINVNHLQISIDASNVVRRGHTVAPEDVGRAANMIKEPQVKELLVSASPGVVAIDGHFDRTQIGKISPLSYICAMLSQTLRQQAQQPATSPGSPMSMPSPSEKGGSRNIVLEYFCALHTADTDDLRGPQGLMRCLTTQLVLSMIANEWIGPSDAVYLPHLRDGEEELLGQRNLHAVCRLFAGLIRLVPQGVSIYCLVDGWSAYEREQLWRADYEVVLNAFREAADVSNSGECTNFKLLLTSPTACRWLGDFLMPGQKVSLRHRDTGDGNWRGSSKGSLKELARASTMSDTSSVFLGGVPLDEYGNDGIGGEHDRRFSS